MAVPRLDGLQIDQDLRLHRRASRMQRVAWALMAALVLAAAAGLLGSGPLSHARAVAPGLMTVEYQRFARFETNDTLTVRLLPAATAADTVRLSLDREFLDRARLASIVPAPVRVESAAGRIIHVFAVAERGAPMVVIFHFDPERIGAYRGRVGLESPAGARRLAFRQLVYP